MADPLCSMMHLLMARPTACCPQLAVIALPQSAVVTNGHAPLHTLHHQSMYLTGANAPVIIIGNATQQYHSCAIMVHVQSATTSLMEQFAHGFEHPHVTSLGGNYHHDQLGAGTPSTVQNAPLPNTYTSSSSRGRVQVTPAVLTSQVEPACPPMEDKITPGDLYTNMPMMVNEANVAQGTMFPNFDGYEVLLSRPVLYSL
ncbi:hypothetical protein EDC04DRAFT_2901079 [Pisolithus marmoratus]|nr:hypothetical protein EDC04DRAFT_2901079 [Pisolithus marmoratus]